MSSVRLTTTLVYYDGPQVVEATDAIGGHYIAVMVPQEHGKDRYLVAGVAPERLRQFRTGALDLRSLLIERDDTAWFLGTPEENVGGTLELHPQEALLAASGFLPDEGFVLHDLVVQTSVLREARERSNLVVEMAVDPPEAAVDHRIRLATLVGLLGHVQTVLKHAYRTALRELSFESRRAIDRTDAYLLDVVVPAAPGSFRVVLEATAGPDLLGESELARAMRRVDTLFDKVENPQATLETVKANHGHFAEAYLRLLRFLLESKTGFRYAWAEPNFPSPRTRAISHSAAGPIVELLSSVADLGTEDVKFAGILEEADVRRHTWRIATGEETYSGTVRSGGPTLKGLVIGSRYRFSCIEELTETAGTGREQRTLYLVDYQRA